MVKSLAILFVAVFAFSEVSWKREIVESGGDFWDFTWNALAVDTSGMPHIVYNELAINYRIVYARRNTSSWQREIIESGPDLFYYAFSMVFDADNIPHVSYYRRDDAVGKTYVCYARREDTGWQRTTVDSCANYWYWYTYSSIDVDTLGLPGIAYILWNPADSLHYIKYAHYNGTDWDASVVEYDSAFANSQIWPTDMSPSLKYDSRNTPFIAFYQYYHQVDTIKIACYDDTQNQWVVEPAIAMPMTAPPVSLQLNSLDDPCVAHGWGPYVAYSWCDSVSWHTESTGTTMGWSGIQIILDLDILDNPHIVYLPDPTIGHPCYSYKKDGVWHNCGWIEPNLYLITFDVHISFDLDENDQPHVLYPCESSTHRYLKYAKGTVDGVEEMDGIQVPRVLRLDICPNPFKKTTQIRYVIAEGSEGNIVIYDRSGRVVKRFARADVRHSSQISWDGCDDYDTPVPAGVYFVHLAIADHSEIVKVVLLR